MGSSNPDFPCYDDGYDTKSIVPMLKEEYIRKIGLNIDRKLEYLKILGEQAREEKG